MIRRASRFSSRLALLLGLLLIGPAHAELPPSVADALRAAHIPETAVGVIVQPVDAGQPLIAHNTALAMNPASVMKLLTTYAALDLLGPAWSWNTPVWLQGTVNDGVLEGNLVIKGSGDPKLVPERLWLLMRRVQQLGVREIHGDIVLDHSAFSVPEQNPAEFDGEPLRPYNVRADALLLGYRSVLIGLTPDAARGLALVSVDPPLAGVSADASVPLSAGACNDWRGELKADFSDPQRLRLAGSFPAACGEKTWPLAYAEPRRYDERLLLGLWREMGGRITGAVREGAAPTTPPPTPRRHRPLPNRHPRPSARWARSVAPTAIAHRASASCAGRRASDTAARSASRSPSARRSGSASA